jgi:putative ABC transport system substrate-binding protein
MTPGTSAPRRLVLAAAGALLLPRAARAQPARRRRIAWLGLGSRFQNEPFLGAFREGLRALGYRDDDIEIEIRYADGYRDRLADLAAELVRLAPEVIVTGTSAAVLGNLDDPDRHGGCRRSGRRRVRRQPCAPGRQRHRLVQSCAGDGGEAAAAAQDHNSQRRAHSHPAQPRQPRGHPPVPGRATSGPNLRVELLSVEARVPGEIDGAFATMTREHADALLVVTDNIFGLARDKIAELATSHKLPAIYQSREFVAVGGLMSYGANQTDLFRYVAAYVDKILKGAKPADLPVEQPTKFEFVINLKTARAIGTDISPSLLARADEVIE